MPKRLLVVNVVLAGIGVIFLAALVREVVGSRPLPPPPRAAQSVPAASATLAGESQDVPLPEYNVIAARNPFNPNRSEFAAAKSAPTSKPVLHGIVLNGEQSRAYIEDPAAKRTVGYGVGDTVAGGRLEAISADRVVIARPEGALEVLLQDPSKPRSKTPAVTAGAAGPSNVTPAVTAAPIPPQPRRRGGPDANQPAAPRGSETR